MPKHKAIKTPEEFLSLFYAFKEWKLAQVVIVPTVNKFGEQTDIKHTPPLTWAGFDAWLYEHKIIEITDEYRYNRDNRYAAFAGVIRAITAQMYTNKFEGAACGAFNANIIARDLGLANKQELTGQDGKALNPTVTVQLSKDQERFNQT